jgi:hypothetical protein
VQAGVPIHDTVDHRVIGGDGVSDKPGFVFQFLKLRGDGAGRHIEPLLRQFICQRARGNGYIDDDDQHRRQKDRYDRDD